MKAIALVVVLGGVAYTYAPDHVDVRIIDLDNIRDGDDPEPLPRECGFEELVNKAMLEAGTDYYWEGRKHATD